MQYILLRTTFIDDLIIGQALIAALTKKGCGNFQGFRSGWRFWHTSHVVRWGQIALKQLSYALLK